MDEADLAPSQGHAVPSTSISSRAVVKEVLDILENTCGSSDGAQVYDSDALEAWEESLAQGSLEGLGAACQHCPGSIWTHGQGKVDADVGGAVVAGAGH